MRCRKAMTVAVATASVLGAAFLSGPAALAAPSSAPSTFHADDVIYTYKWKVTHVGSPYTTYGGWRDCVSVTKEPKPYTTSCTLSTSTSNTVTGTINVSIGVISASVGYSATSSVSVTGGASFGIPAYSGGYIQWRPVYTTRDVTQKEYQCLSGGNYCTLFGGGDAVVAHAHKYKAPGFRYAP